MRARVPVLCLTFLAAARGPPGGATPLPTSPCSCCPLKPAAATGPELLDGRPHGDEGELLQHFEAEVEASISRLRQLKAANEGTQAAISDVVAQVGCLCALFLQHILRVRAEGGCLIISTRVAALPGAALPLPHPTLPPACTLAACARLLRRMTGWSGSAQQWRGSWRGCSRTWRSTRRTWANHCRSCPRVGGGTLVGWCGVFPLL